MYMRLMVLVVCVLALAGCASTEMKSYVGKDIREVMLTNGQPIGAIDMGGGVRAFQFMWGGANTAAMTSQTTTNIDLSGNDSWFRKGEIASSGNALITAGCIVAYLTKWDNQKQSWVIYDYRIPKKLVC